MNNCNKINSIEKLNLEKLIDKIWEEYRNEHYMYAVKLSQKGLIRASKTNDKLWVQMFDTLYREMISSYNESRNTKGEKRNTDMHILIKNHQEIKVNSAL